MPYCLLRVVWQAVELRALLRISVSECRHEVGGEKILLGARGVRSGASHTPTDVDRPVPAATVSMRGATDPGR
jgi:hypothetical protein